MANFNIYNAVTDKFYEGPEEIDEAKARRYAVEEEIREQKAKEKREARIAKAISDYEYYEDVRASIQHQKEMKEYEEKQRLEQRRKEEEERKALIERDKHIDLARERRDNLSPFKRLFTKKIHSFKRGLGYYNPDNMSNQQIDRLYGGKSK